MPYSDLTKKFENVRDYLGEFYIYGFRKKNEIVLKQDQKEKKRNEMKKMKEPQQQELMMTESGR